MLREKTSESESARPWIMNLHLSYLYSLSNPYSANLQTEIGWVPADPNLNWVEIWVTLFSPRHSSMTRIFNIGTRFQSQKTRSNCLFSKEECDSSTWLVSRYWLLRSKAQVPSWQMFVLDNLILVTTNVISITFGNDYYIQGGSKLLDKFQDYL